MRFPRKRGRQGREPHSPMLDIIFAIKFVHMIAVAVMFGSWLCIAVFMVLAHGSGSASVVALTSRLVVRAEMMLMAAAVALQPISGFPLAWAIGLSPLNEYWIVLSLAIYAAIVAAWLAIVGIEMRMRNVTQEAALSGAPLSDAYRRLFHLWSVLAVAFLAGIIAVMALMIWQPQWS
jgi:uncharacterized membrane protein